MAASDSFVSSIYADALPASPSRRKPASREFFWSLVFLLETCLDCFLAAGCAFLIFSFGIGAGAPRNPAVVSLGFGLATALSLRSMPVRRWSCTLVTIRETERVVRATIHSACFLFLLDLLRVCEISPAGFIAALVLIPAALIAVRRAFAAMLRAISARGYGLDRAVIYGPSDAARQIASTLMYAPRHGLCPVAVVLDDAPAPDRIFRMRDRRLRQIAVTREPVSVSLLHALRCDVLIVAAPHLSTRQIEDLREVVDQAHSSIAILDERVSGAEWIDIDGLHLLSNVEPVAAWHCGLARRMADVALSLVLLVLLAPLMLLIAFLIGIDSRGPILFRQDRVGKNGQIFRIFKFRSLHVTAPAYDCSPTQPNDPRITRMGRFLRRAGLDELPQLFNVLLGHMSLVGPRPEMPFLVDRYRSEHRPRLQVRPGITGLWQLSADRELPIHENTQYDLYYIRNRTLCMDWAILIHTLFFALCGGA